MGGRWQKCATESINIYNNTSASAKDWKLEITYKGTPAVDQIWGGEYKISGKTVSIKAVDYTQEIPAKGSINLGYNFSSDDLAVEKYVLYVNDTQYSGDGLKMVASAPEKTDSNETSGGGKIQNPLPLRRKTIQMFRERSHLKHMENFR